MALPDRFSPLCYLPFFDGAFLAVFFGALFFTAAAGFSNFFFILYLPDKIKGLSAFAALTAKEKLYLAYLGFIHIVLFFWTKVLFVGGLFLHHFFFS